MVVCGERDLAREHLSSVKSQVSLLEDALKSANSQVVSLEDQLEKQIVVLQEERERAAEERKQAAEERERAAEEREAARQRRAKRAAEEIRSLSVQLLEVQREMDQVRQSLGWMLLNRARGVRERVIRRDSRPERYWRAATRFLKSAGS